MNINLPITGTREPPIPSSTTGTRFPVFGYCAIVVRDSTLPFPPGLTLRHRGSPLSIADLEIRMTARLKRVMTDICGLSVAVRTIRPDPNVYYPISFEGCSPAATSREVGSTSVRSLRYLDIEELVTGLDRSCRRACCT